MKQDPTEEAQRQFAIGYATGVLGAYQVYEIMLTCRKS
jgi:hypothetical protein